MSATQRESIDQMMEITRCSENVALNYLTRTDFNVETAVRHFFDGTIPEAAVEATTSPTSENSLPSLDTNSSPNNSSHTSVSLPRYHFVLQLFAQLITLPVRVPLVLLNYLYGFFFGSPTVNYGHIFDYISKEYPQLTEKMRSVFYERNLQQFRSDVQRNDWKWLIAYLHDPNGDQTFFQSLFTNDFSRQVMARGGVVFGSVMGSDDAKRLRPDKTFGRSQKSCLIIFVIRETSLTRKLLISNLSKPNEVAATVDSVLIDLIADEADRKIQENARTEARRLMEEQNREYQESLKRDLERIAKSRSEDEAAKKILEESKQKEMEAESRVKRVQTYKEKLHESQSSTTGSNDLLIRFSTGKKIIKFHEDDSIEKLFDEALQSPLCPLFFQMHQSIPRKAVPCLPKWYYEILVQEELDPKEECLSSGLTFKEAGIAHGTMVYIDNL